MPRTIPVPFHPPRLLATSALVVVLGCTACGGGGPMGSAGSTANTTTGAGRPSSTVTLTDAGNGRSVTIARGDHLRVVLASTYWTIDSTSPEGVLQADSPPVTVARLGSCVPGQGCGTVTVVYTAVRTGGTTVSASRSVCGEALACAPDKRDFRVFVTVR